MRIRSEEIRAREMVTLEHNKSTLKRLARVSSSSDAETNKQEALCKRLLSAQPQCEALLRRLLERSRREGSQAFASIKDGRCSACNMTVAIARIQRAKAGDFINCASCITFLYYDQP